MSGCLIAPSGQQPGDRNIFVERIPMETASCAANLFALRGRASQSLPLLYNEDESKSLTG